MSKDIRDVTTEYNMANAAAKQHCDCHAIATTQTVTVVCASS